MSAKLNYKSQVTANWYAKEWKTLINQNETRMIWDGYDWPEDAIKWKLW